MRARRGAFLVLKCVFIVVVSAGYSENLASAPEHASLIASKSAALQKVVETWY